MEFLRALNRTLKPECYVLKGGTNLRFFFGSIRYSEDLDIDVKGITVSALKDKVMAIIQSPTLNTILRPFNIGEIIPPDLGKAKQTQTVQRFKVHLITTDGEDLFTKVEFSRRGFEPGTKVEMVTPAVTRFYKSVPLIVPHYSLETAARQKIRALADRKEIQARDLFDLFILHNRVEDTKAIKGTPREKVAVANKNILSLTYSQYRDTVVDYLPEEDQPAWSSETFWDEIRLRTSAFLENLLKEYDKGVSHNKIDNLPEAILERDKERRRLSSHCTTQAMSDAVTTQKQPGPSGSSIFGSLRRCSSVMCHSGHRTFPCQSYDKGTRVVPCTNLKSGTPNSQFYCATPPKVSLLKAIRLLDRPVFTARELSAVSARSFSSVSQSLKRLAQEEMVTQIKKGLWADTHSPQFSPLVVINFLLPRHRTYLSFVSALHLHGMVSQIPQVITLASTAHSQVIRTPVGVYSIHQITPSFFGGFDWYQGKGGFLIAEAEKALVDCLYIASRKGRRFASFPELTFPEGFQKAKAFGWLEKISDLRLRTSVRNKLEQSI